MSLALVSNVAKTNGNKSLLRSFISNFTSEEFFSDIVGTALFPADFGNGSSLLKSDSIIEYLRNFLKDVVKTTHHHNFPNHVQIRKQAELVSSILTIRESLPTVVSYDNVFQYINVPDLAAKKIINTAITNKIESLDIFKENLNNIINIINTYNEIKSISSNLLLYDHLAETIDQSTGSIFESIKSYRDLVINSYNDLSKLQILNKIDKQSDYYVLKDGKTTNHLSKSLVDYISDSYSFFKTGYQLFDESIDGFESASIHLISAPSNHGKSLFLINLLRNIIINNIDEFEENDAILLITLEDNIPKVIRRISSILGNCRHNIVKDLYREGHQQIKTLKKSNSDLTSIKDKIVNIFDSVLDKAIKTTTQYKVSLVVKYCNENTFSVGDLSKFVDQLRVTDKLNTKLIVLDYVDCAKPTMDGFKVGDDYNNQGQILHELRQLTVNLDIPIITATQNSRASENLSGEMSNALVGDSYKKVRYTDYLYMSRMANNKTFLNSDVAIDTIDNSTKIDRSNPNTLIALENLQNTLIPYEVKITKAKEGKRDKKKFMLFCTENLRIYENIDQYLDDKDELASNSRELEQKLLEINQPSIPLSLDETLSFFNP